VPLGQPPHAQRSLRSPRSAASARPGSVRGAPGGCQATGGCLAQPFLQGETPRTPPSWRRAGRPQQETPRAQAGTVPGVAGMPPKQRWQARPSIPLPALVTAAAKPLVATKLCEGSVAVAMAAS